MGEWSTMKGNPLNQNCPALLGAMGQDGIEIGIGIGDMSGV